jgi:ribonuclease-3
MSGSAHPMAYDEILSAFIARNRLDAEPGSRARALLAAALTHRTYANEHGGEDNERLEFLGDSALNFITADAVFAHFPAAPEGDLSRARAALVRRDTLAAWARACGVDAVLRLGRGGMRDGQAQNASVLEGTFEAVVGAVYLAHGLEAARAFLAPHLHDALAAMHLATAGRDARTVLQEWVQGETGQTPEYREAAVTGTASAPVFTVEVWRGDVLLGSGTGTSKQQAAHRAAEAALHAVEAGRNASPNRHDAPGSRRARSRAAWDDEQ